MGRDVIHVDSWLSGHLGCPAFHLSASVESPQREDLPSGAAFVDAKVGVEAVQRVQGLEALGFRLVDTGVQLKRDAAPLDLPDGRCRFAAPADEAAVRAIAGRAITRSRFHLDPRIPRATANQLKSDWAGNFFLGRRGEWMVVAEDDREVCGFLQLLRSPDGGLVIDLIAVSAEHRGRGLGSQMIAFAAGQCLERAAPLTVGTQIANIRSLALYQRLGFSISSASYVLHLHQTASPHEH